MAAGTWKASASASKAYAISQSKAGLWVGFFVFSADNSNSYQCLIVSKRWRISNFHDEDHSMRSASHDIFGEPQDVLQLKDAPVPQPGKGQVRIRTILSPIHNHDIWTVRGSYGYKPPLPGATRGKVGQSP